MGGESYHAGSILRQVYVAVSMPYVTLRNGEHMNETHVEFALARERADGRMMRSETDILHRRLDVLALNMTLASRSRRLSGKWAGSLPNGQAELAPSSPTQICLVCVRSSLRT